MKISFSGIFFGLICIGMGFFFLAGTWGVYLDYSRVKDYSGRAAGHITKKYFQTATDGSGNYYLDYWFMSSAGSKIVATSNISKQQWDALQVNDSLEIRFDPTHPKSNIPLYGGSPSLVWAFFTLLMGAVFMVFGCLRILKSLMKKNRTHNIVFWIAV